MLLAILVHTLALAASVRCSRHTSWYHKLSDQRAQASWIWGLGWGLGDGEVVVVDREPIVSFPSRLAFFGGRVSQPGMLGYILPLSSFTVPCDDDPADDGDGTILDGSEGEDEGEQKPNKGCPRLCIPAKHPANNETWFALVQRGGCPFADKAREAQRLGARAIIVGGSTSNRDELVSMYSNTDSSDITIPATYITYTSYRHIFSLLSTSTTTISGLRTLSVLLTSDPTWEWYSPVLTFLLLLLLPSMLTMCTLIVHRVRSARAERQERAPQDFVNSLPTRVWNGTGWEKDIESTAGIVVPAATTVDKNGDSTDTVAQPSTSVPSPADDDELPHPHWFSSQVECAICISTFERGDRVRILPCGHIFHLEEIDGWLILRKKLCPVCKADVTLPPAAVQPSSPPNPSTLPLSNPLIIIREQDPGSDEPQASSSGSNAPRPPSRTSTPPPPTERTPLLPARSASSESISAGGS